IIRAAIRIFARQGYLRTTLNQVGEEAGYTGGLVSHRFGSKAGLLKAVITDSGTRFLQDQSGASRETESAEAALKNYIATYMEEVTLPESYLRALYVIMGEALGGDEEIQKQVAAFNQRTRRRITSIVQRGIDNGEFNKGVAAEDAGVLIMGLLRGVVMQYLFDREALDITRMVPQVQLAALGSLR
ncbi:MAG: TetR/AcrR family transcriptional regulator, partial [Gammaproteobacteria bacterium]